MPAPSYVVATAGHVDHGKSTLVRALTGMEPDRWSEEQRRGLTIDLGFGWTTLDDCEVGFVDVPGHERFIANMLAGLGPAPVVMLVVAADEGWRAQSSEHRDAIAALGISHGLVVITRSDLADTSSVQQVAEQVRAELAGTGLRDAPIVAVSAVTGNGMEELRAALTTVLRRLPEPETQAPLRFWVDRAFTIKGAGTVVTGTLGAGSLTPDTALELLGSGGRRPVTIRGLHHHNGPIDSIGPVSRVAINLRGVPAEQVSRGDVLVTPGAWQVTDTIDVRRSAGSRLTGLPDQVVVHVGTAALAARLRPFDDEHGRLLMPYPLPLARLDRLVLRDPGSRRIIGGVRVLDLDPPTLSRRGDGRRRAEALAQHGDPVAEIVRRGFLHADRLRLLGYAAPTVGVRELGEWWVSEDQFAHWRDALHAHITELFAQDPISPGLSRDAAVTALGLPDPSLLAPIATATELHYDGRHVRLETADLGPSESAIQELERRLEVDPFQAPEAEELAGLNLGQRELAAAERTGRVIRLAGGSVVLLPKAPAQAMRELAKLEQPFTTSQARQALGSTRRVVIPLLEHLDQRGWTQRVDATHRRIRS